MKCKEIIKYLEEWAPKAVAWERDNVGLQVGTDERQLKNIMVSLDLNINVIEEAKKKNCNLIITHHPLLFNSLNKIDTQTDTTSKLIEKLIKNNITLYSAHTNLDFTKHGVSFQLAKRIKLQNINFLTHLSEHQVKLAVFVPEENVDAVAAAIHSAGGGIIGEYSHCSFRLRGTGTFKGSDASNPYVGKKGRLEKVKEIRLEVLIDTWKLSSVTAAMKQAHPYEEVAYDLYPLKNENVNYGAGAIGELETAISKKEFLDHISKTLRIKNFRYSNSKSDKIKKVAVCGGSCSNLLNVAVKQGADAFVTADIKYHTFQEAESKILLIDAGHYETEIHSLDEVQKRLKYFLKKDYNSKVYKYKGSTNPVIFYNN
ncbi:putative GTP cyclohydrolase 1 type 2 [bacterium BMS3Abin03]|nr:putative GTP cyclohydrolase 1 type 2 [bacterium BMS3Abin03]HDZ58822.1 Nif3-like dinuclear metal center hexameric protein [Ignavibacteriales bacterium]